MNYDMYLKACIEAAKAGGLSILNYRPAKVETKGDKYVGSHAIVTSADYMAQDAILGTLDCYDKDSMFITEEHVKDEKFRRRILRSDALHLLETSGVYIIDELDGSSSFEKGHYEWAVSVGYVRELEHLAGAVFAPKIEGGTLFSASRGDGAFIHNNVKSEQIRVSDCDNLENAYVIAGPDCFLTKYPVHNRALTVLGDKSRTINSNGSCALPLGLVAAGHADALVESLQCPWDWAAGKLLVEESGGKILFYEIEKGEIKPLKKLEPKHYDPDKRAVGFVAGNEKMVTDVMDILLSLQ